MSVHAYLPVVVVVSVRAPHCLEMVHVVVHVYVVVLYQFNRQFLSGVGKRAILGVFASVLIYTGLS